jgi:hypothetical protein
VNLFEATLKLYNYQPVSHFQVLTKIDAFNRQNARQNYYRDIKSKYDKPPNQDGCLGIRPEKFSEKSGGDQHTAWI